MSEHRVKLHWERGAREYTYESYPRDHVWEFSGGSRLAASAAPEYKGSPELANPEEAFVAALSSCHMLTFLAIAARKRLVIDGYTDAAVGYLEKNGAGKLAITRVVLHPHVVFGGTPATPEDLAHMHEQAHAHCFIASSVSTEVTVEPA
jgi:organic hydroperoxide reductase OsmC/OhrA